MHTECDSSTKAKRIADILQAIPASNSEAIDLVSLCGHAKGQCSCMPCLTALVEVLEAFGAICVVSNSADRMPRIKASSETALYFLRSLAAYVKHDLQLVADWERTGAVPEGFMANTLNSGAQLLYVMERNRVRTCGDDTPTRVVHVSQALIVARVERKPDPLFLMQYDDRALRYQLIGGRKRHKDNLAVDVMKREMQEELGLNRLRYGEDYTLAEVIPELVCRELSRSYGAYTEYHFTIYHATFSLPKLVLGPHDRWITVAELMEGKTATGGLVITHESHNYFRDIDAQLPGGLKGLASSVSVPLSPKAVGQPILELKPGIWGMNVDLRALWRRLRGRVQEDTE